MAINKEFEINMNKKVKILLTDYGKEILKKHFEDLNSLKFMPNPDNEITICLWEISNIFGHILYMGNPNIPFVDNKIKIDLN